MKKVEAEWHLWFLILQIPYFQNSLSHSFSSHLPCPFRVGGCVYASEVPRWPWWVGKRIGRRRGRLRISSRSNTSSCPAWVRPWSAVTGVPYLGRRRICRGGTRWDGLWWRELSQWWRCCLPYSFGIWVAALRPCSNVPLAIDFKEQCCQRSCSQLLVCAMVKSWMPYWGMVINQPHIHLQRNLTMAHVSLTVLVLHFMMSDVVNPIIKQSQNHHK